MIRTFAYCTYEEAALALAAGWRWLCAHNAYAGIVEWPHEGEPVDWRRHL